jgi:hypothetical protein
MGKMQSFSVQPGGTCDNYLVVGFKELKQIVGLYFGLNV